MCYRKLPNYASSVKYLLKPVLTKLNWLSKPSPPIMCYRKLPNYAGSAKYLIKPVSTKLNWLSKPSPPIMCYRKLPNYAMIIIPSLTAFLVSA